MVGSVVTVEISLSRRTRSATCILGDAEVEDCKFIRNSEGLCVQLLYTIWKICHGNCIYASDCNVCQEHNSLDGICAGGPYIYCIRY